MKFKGGFIVFILAIFKGSCQLELSSSFLGGSVCPNQHVAFYCNASGALNDFIWSLNDVVIHEYRSTATEFIQHNQMTSTYSVLFRNITSAQVHESELIFTSLPSGSTFKVTCTLGRNPVSLTTKILGGNPPPVSILTADVTGSVAQVSWTHPDPSVIQYYRVLRNGQKYLDIIESVLTLENCDQQIYNLTIIAVDHCNNSGNATTITIIGNKTTSDSFVTTTSEITTDGGCDGAGQSSNSSSSSMFVITVTILVILLLVATGFMIGNTTAYVIIMKRRMEGKLEIKSMKLELNKDEDYVIVDKKKYTYTKQQTDDAKSLEMETPTKDLNIPG